MFNEKEIPHKEPILHWTKAVAVILLLILAFQCVMSLRQKSPTWDETHYLGIGKYLLTHFTWNTQGSILHPPLTFFMHDIPLLFFPTPEIMPLGDHHSRFWLGVADVKKGNRILMSDRYDGETLFFLSRLFMIPLSIVLGIFVFLWAKDLYSSYAGLLALFLYCFSPNMLAHARLITPDLSLTCFSFLSIYFYWKFISLGKKPRHLFFSALCFGLALASKYSALLLFPIFIFIFIINTIVEFFTFSCNFGVVRKNVLNLLFLFSLCVIPILIFYGFDLSPYFDGLVFQLKKSEWGHAAFLEGSISWEGWWYFFIYAFLLKTPIPTLAFIIIALVLGNNLKSILKKREFFLIIPILSYIIFFSYTHQCVGLRYILPVYPFIFVFVSRILNMWIKPRKVVGSLVVGLSVWYLVGTIRIYPHYLAYFNEFVGGPSNGYKYLVDSNLDWGQDLKLLKQYMDAQGIKEIYLDYFGSIDPAFYHISYKKIDENTSLFPKGWYAVSATKLQGVYSLKREGSYAELKKKKPIAHIGYTIFVYSID